MEFLADTNNDPELTDDEMEEQNEGGGGTGEAQPQHAQPAQTTIPIRINKEKNVASVFDTMEFADPSRFSHSNKASSTWSRMRPKYPHLDKTVQKVKFDVGQPTPGAPFGTLVEVGCVLLKGHESDHRRNVLTQLCNHFSISTGIIDTLEEKYAGGGGSSSHIAEEHMNEDTDAEGGEGAEEEGAQEEGGEIGAMVEGDAILDLHVDSKGKKGRVYDVAKYLEPDRRCNFVVADAIKADPTLKKGIENDKLDGKGLVQPLANFKTLLKFALIGGGDVENDHRMTACEQICDKFGQNHSVIDEIIESIEEHEAAKRLKESTEGAEETPSKKATKKRKSPPASGAKGKTSKAAKTSTTSAKKGKKTADTKKKETKKSEKKSPTKKDTKKSPAEPKAKKQKISISSNEGGSSKMIDFESIKAKSMMAEHVMPRLESIAQSNMSAEAKKVLEDSILAPFRT